MPLRPTAPMVVLLLAGCASSTRSAPQADSRFEDVQSRGAIVMGVDQYSSSHSFDDLPDGGRITLTRNDLTDSAGAAMIRAHLQHVADSFAVGVFSDPAQVHGQEVPGTRVMTRKRDLIRYRVAGRPGGGELQIRTSDREAVDAVHLFLAFQRQDHRVVGHHGEGER